MHYAFHVLLDIRLRMVFALELHLDAGHIFPLLLLLENHHHSEVVSEFLGLKLGSCGIVNSVMLL